MSMLIAIVALGILLAGWVCYPAILYLLPRRARTGEVAGTDPFDPVTVVIATRESPEVVGTRVASLLTTTWPHELLRIVIGVDPNATHSLDAYRTVVPGHGGIVVVAGDAPGGKAATLNAAMREVQTALVVFADSAQQFEPGAIAELVRLLHRPGVGGVTGELATDVERGVFGLFWRYELLLRQLESRRGLVVNVTGAIHALRRECWRPLPPGIICDDLLIPLQIGRQGWRVEVAEGAHARDGRIFSREAQLRRKVRTLTGIFQICAWQPWVLLPWAHRLWLAFVCHKLVRVATPLLVAVFLGGLAVSLPTHSLIIATAVIAVAGMLGLLGLVLLGRPLMPIIRECGWFVRMASAPLIATGRALKGDWTHW